MQHLYNHDETEFFSSSTHLHPHLQYQHDNPSLSPQQSSASDVDETNSTPPSSSVVVHRTVTVPSKIVKKKKQGKKKRKDPNEPQKPVSPYALFFRDTQNDIKKKLANPSFGEISKVVAHMWENIEPEVKEQYKRKAAAAKKEYLKQLAAYRAVQVSHQTPTMHHLLANNNLGFDPNSMSINSSMGHHQKSYHHATMITDNNNLLSSSQQHQHHHFPSYHHHHHPHPQQQQYCPPSSSIPQQQQQQQQPQTQYTNYHYMNSYVQDPSTVYPTDHSSMHFANHHYDGGHANYSSYDSNNNHHHHSHYANHPPPHHHHHQQQHYGLLRPAIESELYSSYYNPSSSELDSSSISSIANENLLHNLNHSMTSNHTLHYTDLSSMSSSSTMNTSTEKNYEYNNNSLTASTSTTPTTTTTTTLNETDPLQKDEDRSTSTINNENNFHWNQTTCLATQW